MPVGDLLYVNQTKSVPNRLMKDPLRLSTADGILKLLSVVLDRQVLLGLPSYQCYKQPRRS
jgi:hypothetical protein